MASGPVSQLPGGLLKVFGYPFGREPVTNDTSQTFLEMQRRQPPEMAISKYAPMVSTDYPEAGKNLGGADMVSRHKGTFEFKRWFAMPNGRLQQLHGTTIEVELDVQGSLRSITGQGSYHVNDPDLGSVLRILVSEPSGDFEFLIAESSWSGKLESSDLPGCDHRISLVSCKPC